MKYYNKSASDYLGILVMCSLQSYTKKTGKLPNGNHLGLFVFIFYFLLQSLINF